MSSSTVEVTVRQNVEPGALLIADNHRYRVLKLLTKAKVKHAGVERAPHILTSNQRGRGNDSVTVLRRIRFAVAVNMASSNVLHCTPADVW